MLPKSYAQTSLDRRRDSGTAADWPHRAATDRVVGGAATGRVDQGGPREVAAGNGEALMRRRSATADRGTVSAPLVVSAPALLGESAPAARRSVSVVLRPGGMPSSLDGRAPSAGLVGRQRRREDKRLVAGAGIESHDSFADDESQAVVTWR